MVDNLSIIIPTHNRHNFLLRALEYYQEAGSSLIVVDSSACMFDTQLLPEGTRYLHLPGVSPSEKIRKALSIIDTPYTQFAADDDFVLLEALAEGVEFLNQNEDFGSVQGWHLMFTFKPRTDVQIEIPEVAPLTGSPLKSWTDYLLRWLPGLSPRKELPKPEEHVNWVFNLIGVHAFAKDLQICANDPLDRVRTQLNPYMNKFYALQRTDIAKSYFLGLCPLLEEKGVIGNVELFEIGQAVNLVYWGKHRTLQRPWIFRESLENSCAEKFYDDREQESPTLVRMRDESHPEYLGFISSLVEHFNKISPVQNLQAILEKAMNGYLDDYLPKWLRSQIPHVIDYREMIYRPDDIERMEAINKLVSEHKAQLLDSDWAKLSILNETARVI